MEFDPTKVEQWMIGCWWGDGLMSVNGATITIGVCLMSLLRDPRPVGHTPLDQGWSCFTQIDKKTTCRYIPPIF